MVVRTRRKRAEATGKSTSQRLKGERRTAGRVRAIEPLEPRVVMTVSVNFNNGHLEIEGDGNDNELAIFSTLVGSVPYVTVRDGQSTVFDGTPSGQNVPTASVVSISATGGDGDDWIGLGGVSWLTGYVNVTSVTLEGNAGNDRLDGTEFSDTIDGGDGNDEIYGDLGDDSLIGGAGNDHYSISDDTGSDVVIELAAGGSDSLNFSGATVPLTLSLASSDPQNWGGGILELSDGANFEHVIGTIQDDFIFGNAANNYLFGFDGADTLIGSGGDDLLLGMAGDDIISGGDGRDLLIGGTEIDALSGDLGDDVLVSGDFDIMSLFSTTLSDFILSLDQIVGAWTANETVAERLLNLTGGPGATNPLPAALRLTPGGSLLDDGELDALLPLAGNDLVFLDSRSDRLTKASPNTATYVQIDPTWDLLTADLEDGVLTVTYQGTGEIVYSVDSSGYLLVNGEHVLGSPLLATDLSQIISLPGQTADGVNDAALYGAEFVNLAAIIEKTPGPMSPPEVDAAMVESLLETNAGPDWALYTTLTLEELADAAMAGNYGPVWEIVGAARTAATMLYSRSAPFLGWHAVADGLVRRRGGIAERGASALSAGEEGGGSVSIHDAEPVNEGEWANFKVTHDAEFHDGFSVDWHTASGSAIGGTAPCNGDFLAADGTLAWGDDDEGEYYASVRTFNDQLVESTESFQVALTDVDNDTVDLDGDEGDLEIGDSSSATGTILDTSTLPSVSVGSAVAVEGDFLRIPVSLSHAYQVPVTIFWTTQDITTEGSEDYSPASGSITFDPMTCSQPGETFKYIYISTKADTVEESEPETFEINISSGSNYLVAQATGTAAIYDNLDLRAWTPNTQPFIPVTVPDTEEENPGVFIRRNGDHDSGNPNFADSALNFVPGENDLIAVDIFVPAYMPAGAQYVFKRSGDSINLWDAATKGINQNGVPRFQGTNEITLNLPPGGYRMFVEWRTPGTGQDTATLETYMLLNDQRTITDRLVIHPFTSIVVALGGEDQTPTDPADPNHGTFKTAIELYAQDRYDVHMYDEDAVNNFGVGAAYDEVVSAIRERGVTSVAIYGYSHGGGSTFDLANRLDSDRSTIGTFTIAFTAYIDAIIQDLLPLPEKRRPPGTAWHLNIYQRHLPIRGEAMNGQANEDVNANMDFDSNIDHFDIDDVGPVRQRVRDRLKAHVATL